MQKKKALACHFFPFRSIDIIPPHERKLSNARKSQKDDFHSESLYCLRFPFCDVQLLTRTGFDALRILTVFIFGKSFQTFYPLPDDKILNWSKLKQVAGDILKCI